MYGDCKTKKDCVGHNHELWEYIARLTLKTCAFPKKKPVILYYARNVHTSLQSSSMQTQYTVTVTLMSDALP